MILVAVVGVVAFSAKIYGIIFSAQGRETFSVTSGYIPSKAGLRQETKERQKKKTPMDARKKKVLS